MLEEPHVPLLACMLQSSRGRAVAELATPTMGGVTHLKFTPDGRLLFSGSRKDDGIVCWDIRRTKEVGRRFALNSFVSTRQQQLGVGLEYF